MVDVLVYLYENYWRPDACPRHEQLARKLTAVGFASDEIEEALSWLDGARALPARQSLGRQHRRLLGVVGHAARFVRCWGAAAVRLWNCALE